MNAKVYSKDGKEAGNVTLPESVFGVAWNADLVHEVVLGMQANARGISSAHTKGRGEVSGGGKKPFKQKGTGNARQGSTRSPLMPGGGTVFGPKPRSYEQKVNKKVMLKAIHSILADRFQSGKLIVVVKPGTSREQVQAVGSMKHSMVEKPGSVSPCLALDFRLVARSAALS